MRCAKNFAWHVDLNSQLATSSGCGRRSALSSYEFFRGSVKRVTLGYEPKGLGCRFACRRSSAVSRGVLLAVRESSKAPGPPEKEHPGSVDGEKHMDVEEVSELIGLIYYAALDTDTWPVLLNRLADALSARCGVI